MQMILHGPIMPKEECKGSQINLAHSELKARQKNFLDALSNSGRPFDYMVKAGQTARPKTVT